MADTDSAHVHVHEGPNVRAYLVIFGALAVFTLISFVANYAAHPEVGWITPYASFAIILIVAVVKAVLVAMFFMHLKWDWSRVYFMIVPVLILGTMMMFVLLPDIVLGWKSQQAAAQIEQRNPWIPARR
jgi:caa(3)-type oxidase subunit IV